MNQYTYKLIPVQKIQHITVWRQWIQIEIKFE